MSKIKTNKVASAIVTIILVAAVVSPLAYALRIGIPRLSLDEIKSLVAVLLSATMLVMSLSTLVQKALTNASTK